MLDGDPDPVIPEMVIAEGRRIAVPAPDPMVTIKYPVPAHPYPAESDFYPVGGRIGKIIPYNHIVITPSFSLIHRALPGP